MSEMFGPGTAAESGGLEMQKKNHKKFGKYNHINLLFTKPCIFAGNDFFSFC